MRLSKNLNNKYEHNYYKINENSEETIIIDKNEYNKINYLIRGGDAISLDNLEIKTYVRKIIFRHEFIYEFILPILDEYNREIEKKIQSDTNLNYNNLNMYVSGNTSLIINLEDYKDKFNSEDYEYYYKLFEKSDIDAMVVINSSDINDKNKNYKNIIRSISQRLLYKYKDILLNNRMFMYYIQYYVIDYLNNNDEFINNYDIKSIKKNKLPNQIKYENKEFISKWSVIDDIPNNLFIRINEGLKFNENETTDLYRIMIPYTCLLNNNNKISIWSELIDISIKEIKINFNENEIDNIHIKINQIKNIFDDNIRLKKETNIDDIPKTNDNYNVSKIMWFLAHNNSDYITKKKYNNLYINVLTLKGYIYESILIILNTPDDPKINNRIRRLHFILSILKKH